jgi:hypothetical protein
MLLPARSRLTTRSRPHLLQLLLLVSALCGSEAKKKVEKKSKGAVVFIDGLPPACGGRQHSKQEIIDFFTDSVAGRRTRAEILAQTDRYSTDLEHHCTPGLAQESEVFEKLQVLAWSA